MTDREVMQQALEAWDDPMKDLKDLCVAMDAIRTALEQQAEALQAMNDQLITGTSIMLDGKRVDPASVYKQAEPAWDKPSTSFDKWWDSYHHDPANPFAEGSAAYWAWAGWQGAQRQWVGLTRADIDEIWKGKEMVLPWDYDRTLAIEAKLKEKNDNKSEQPASNP